MSDNYLLSMNAPADCSPEDVERAIQYFIGLPLEELRRRQEINRLAIIATHGSTVLGHDQKMEGMRQLQARAEHLNAAIDRKEFPQ